MLTERDIKFEIGSRYRDRSGWYEVLEVDGKNIRMRYESNGREDTAPIELKRRVFLNISQEEEQVTPYLEEEKNRAYFKTLGYLTNYGFIEAIIPQKSQDGFDSTFRRIKGRHPLPQEEGYYLHHDPDVDKWGTEMRLTFIIPRTISTNDLEFGPDVNIVESPEVDKLRINSNAFCWRLLELGFDLGKGHNTGRIEASIPDAYRPNFQDGRVIA